MSEDRGYRDVRRTQWILFVCCSLLAFIMVVVAIYLFARSRDAGVLEDRGVHTQAILESTNGDRATVTFDASDGRHTEDIDRIGKTLCPETSAIQRFRGCGDVDDGLRFELVYDPRDPSTAEPADALRATFDRNSAFICGAIAIVMVLLAVGRWRWLVAVKRLRDPAVPQHDVRVLRSRRFGVRSAFGASLTLVRADVAAADEQTPVRIMVNAPSGLRALTDGGTIRVVGIPRPGRAVGVVDDGAIAFPTRKAHRAKPAEP